MRDLRQFETPPDRIDRNNPIWQFQKQNNIQNII